VLLECEKKFTVFKCVWLPQKDLEVLGATRKREVHKSRLKNYAIRNKY